MENYDSYLEKLLEKVKGEGILVEVVKERNFLKDAPKLAVQYKKDLGAVPVKSSSGVITNIYLVFEDFDGNIKYYDYPQ